MSEASPKQGMSTGLKVLIGIGAGCGCLLVGLVALGIISAIALPSFLNQANKARESEAKVYVGATNRGQQAYFLEKETFGNTMEELGLGIPNSSESYEYQTQAMQTDPLMAVSMATPTSAEFPLSSYVGLVYALPISSDSTALTTIAILCESTEIAPAEFSLPQAPTPDNPQPQCPEGYSPIQ